MTDNNDNRLTPSQLKQLLRLYIRRGASANFKTTPQGDLEAVPDKDGERRKDAPIPAELLPLLEQLADDGKIPAEWLSELKRYHNQLQQAESKLTPEERELLDKHREKTEAASESQLNQMEAAEELLPDAVRDTLEQQRRLRQSLAGKVAKEWKKKHMPEEEQSSSEDGDDGEEGDNGKPQKDKQSQQDKSEQDDTSDDGDADDGQDDQQGQSDDADDGNDDGSDGDDGDSGDDQGNDDGSDSSNADSPSQQGQDGNSQQGKGDQPSDQQSSGEPQGDSDMSPEDTQEGLDKYREELEKKSGDQGKGDEDDSNGDGESGEGESADGDNQQDGDQNGENQKDNGQQGKDQNQKQEDSSDGLKDYEKELRKKQQEEQQKADQQQQEQQGNGQQGQQGQPGQPGKPGEGQDNAGSAFDLSKMKANEADAYEAKKALERLLSRGRKNPQQLPRWNKRDLAKRLATFRNPMLARKPTLEQKAILMIIDNSPSMAHLEKQSRALAAALSAAGGPNGATVIVCLSSNGEYEHSPRNKTSEDGLWFVNGKCVGRLPEPPPNAGFNTKSAAQSWAWFIRKYLPQKRFDVHIIGFYGDFDGSKRWSYISHTCKDIMCTWFNPTDKGRGEVVEVPNMGAHRNNNSWGFVSEPGYTAGDKRYDTFRGKFFLRVDTIRDIATALKKAIGL